MSADDRYDRELHMFVDEPRDARPAHLLFLRWLLDQEKIERPIADDPAELADHQVRLADLFDRPAANRLCVPRWFGR